MISRSDLLRAANLAGWPRWAVRFLCVASVALLGVLRASTDAEFTFASLALFPVLIMGWMDGRMGGILVAVIAAAMWAMGDHLGGRQFSAQWILLANAATTLAVYGVVALLAAELRVLFEREHGRATTDGLTGLCNRRAFVQRGETESVRAQRYRHAIAVVFIDLDDFKVLNDTKGHEAGDYALLATAKAAMESTRQSDTVARLGGDEFAVLLPETGFDETRQVCIKLLRAINDALADFPPARCSIGAAWFEKADRPFSEMLNTADKLMYEVKAGGKGDVLVRKMGASMNDQVAAPPGFG